MPVPNKGSTKKKSWVYLRINLYRKATAKQRKNIHLEKDYLNMLALITFANLVTSFYSKYKNNKL